MCDFVRRIRIDDGVRQIGGQSDRFAGGAVNRYACQRNGEWDCRTCIVRLVVGECRRHHPAVREDNLRPASYGRKRGNIAAVDAKRKPAAIRICVIAGDSFLNETGFEVVGRMSVNRRVYDLSVCAVFLNFIRYVRVRAREFRREIHGFTALIAAYGFPFFIHEGEIPHVMITAEVVRAFLCDLRADDIIVRVDKHAVRRKLAYVAGAVQPRYVHDVITDRVCTVVLEQQVKRVHCVTGIAVSVEKVVDTARID